MKTGDLVLNLIARLGGRPENEEGYGWQTSPLKRIDKIEVKLDALLRALGYCYYEGESGLRQIPKEKK